MISAEGSVLRRVLHLPARQPFDGAALLDFLAARAVPGVEEVAAGSYRRTVRLPAGPGVVTLTPTGEGLRCELHLPDPSDQDIADVVASAQAVFDLGADSAVIDAHLATDPVLAPLVAKRPGLRIPGHVDGAEVAVRAVIGQQVSVAGARTVAATLTRRWGEPLAEPNGSLTHLFPLPGRLAEAAPEDLPMPRARGRALIELSRALDDGRVDLTPGGQAEARTTARAALLALPGIGPWTASYVAMRALGDPDVFLPTDLGVRHALDRLGIASDPRAAQDQAERWRPWRSYALMHLWTDLAGSATVRA
jgi:AraC family transcriptional regulator of adaptative response / DNA-3-methyladenine glycosylase II